LDEESTVGAVVAGFQRSLPEAKIYVFDNGSTDRTASIARTAGAEVVHSPRRGKGHVVRHMATVVEADAYVLVDGDDTYPADAAHDLLAPLRSGKADMVVATRLGRPAEGAFRLFHSIGNRVIARLIALLSGVPLTDVLSGYRVLSRELVRLLRLRSGGFEIEAEMTLQALAKGFAIVEMPVDYARRPPGSHSKLSTWRDGYLILRSIVLIFKDYKPLFFFSGVAALLALASATAGLAPIVDFYRTGLVLHVPRAILAAGLGTLATISLAVGLILDTIATYHAESISLWREHLRDDSRSGPGKTEAPMP